MGGKPEKAIESINVALSSVCTPSHQCQFRDRGAHFKYQEVELIRAITPGQPQVLHEQLRARLEGQCVSETQKPCVCVKLHFVVKPGLSEGVESLVAGRQ